MKENSIEEAIKRLEKGINDIWFSTTYSQEQEEKDLKILLSDYKRVLKENEQLKNKIMEKELEIIGKEEYIKDSMGEIIEQYYTANEECIPVQKVKDNLIKYQEEYELLLEHQSGKESNRTKYLRGRIHMCQELLESEE